MRTKSSVCRRKAHFLSESDALLAAGRTGLSLRSYRCDRCRQFHLTSRTKGKRVPRPADRAIETPPTTPLSSLPCRKPITEG